LIGKLFGNKKNPAGSDDSVPVKNKSGGKSSASKKPGKSAKAGHQKSANQQKSSRNNRRNKKAKPATPAWTVDQFPVSAIEGKTRFHDLELDDRLMHGIADLGFEYCSPIQAGVLPQTLQGHDAIGKAQTGTGKTAAFLVTIIQDLLSNPITENRYIGEPRALVIAPTRELVVQIGEDAKNLTKYTGLNVATLIGGMDYTKQLNQLKNSLVDIVVATPGRLLDFQTRRDLFLDQVEILVIDEADRMLDMGFIHDIKKILHVLPKQRQNLLFSATFSNDIRHLAKGLVHKPVEISVSPPNTTVKSVEHWIYSVDKNKKSALLRQLIKEKQWPQVLVFSRTKHGANKLAKQLDSAGISAAAIHGNKSQGARTRALAEFKSGKVQVLVATDIAARGLDIDQLPNVVNFDLPHVPEDYVHRIGRTGRAGASGMAVSLVCADEFKQLCDIERLIGELLPRKIAEDFEPVHALQESRLKTKPYKPKKPKKPKTGHRDGQRSGENAQGHAHKKDQPSANGQRKKSAATGAKPSANRRRRKPVSGNR